MKKFFLLLVMALLVGTIWGSEKETTLNKGSTNNELLLSIENFVSINQASDLAMEIEKAELSSNSFAISTIQPGNAEELLLQTISTGRTVGLSINGVSFSNSMAIMLICLTDFEKNCCLVGKNYSPHDLLKEGLVILKLPMQGFVLTSTGEIQRA